MFLEVNQLLDALGGFSLQPFDGVEGVVGGADNIGPPGQGEGRLGFFAKGFRSLSQGHRARVFLVVNIHPNAS